MSHRLHTLPQKEAILFIGNAGQTTLCAINPTVFYPQLSERKPWDAEFMTEEFEALTLLK